MKFTKYFFPYAKKHFSQAFVILLVIVKISSELKILHGTKTKI